MIFLSKCLRSGRRGRGFKSRHLDHVVADSVSLAATFLLYLWKSHLSLTPSLLLSKTSLACLACSLVNALTTAKLRYQLVLVLRKAAPILGHRAMCPIFVSMNIRLCCHLKMSIPRGNREVLLFFVFGRNAT